MLDLHFGCIFCYITIFVQLMQPPLGQPLRGRPTGPIYVKLVESTLFDCIWLIIPAPWIFAVAPISNSSDIKFAFTLNQISLHFLVSVLRMWLFHLSQRGLSPKPTKILWMGARYKIETRHTFNSVAFDLVIDDRPQRTMPFYNLGHVGNLSPRRDRWNS